MNCRISGELFESRTAKIKRGHARPEPSPAWPFAKLPDLLGGTVTDEDRLVAAPSSNGRGKATHGHYSIAASERAAWSPTEPHRHVALGQIQPPKRHGQLTRANDAAKALGLADLKCSRRAREFRPLRQTLRPPDG